MIQWAIEPRHSNINGSQYPFYYFVLPLNTRYNIRMHSMDPPHAFFMCQNLYVLGTQCTPANKANIRSLLKLN